MSESISVTISLVPIIVGALLIYTKPSKKSFDDKIKRSIQNMSEDIFGSGVTGKVVGKIASKGQKLVRKREYYDWLFIATAKWQSGHFWGKYVGVLNTWIRVDSHMDMVDAMEWDEDNKY